VDADGRCTQRKEQDDDDDDQVLRAGPGASLALAGAIMVIALALLHRPSRADGLLAEPPPPMLVRPPTRSCVETATQLGYQTGNRYVANAAVAACRVYAPVPLPRKYPPPIPLGGYPPAPPPPPIPEGYEQPHR
jgi:hypothetical protein